MNEESTSLTWEVRFPLLTNPNILKAWFKAMGMTYFLIMVIMVPIFIGTGEIDGIPPIALIFLGVTLGITILGLLIMLVIFGNSSQAKFTLDDEGVLYESQDNKAKTLSRIAILAGGITGNATTAGAGLISTSKEQISISWKTIFKAKYCEKSHTICLRNQYRDLLQLYCTPENYQTVCEMVMEKVKQKGGEKSYTNRKSPLPRAILATLLVVISCLPLFALIDITKLHLMVPLLILVFSLAMVWMIPFFAYVILPLAAYIPVHLAISLAELRTLKLVSTYTYRKYELLDVGEWIVIGFAIIGLIYLCWTSLRSLKGRYVPVLMQDQ